VAGTRDVSPVTRHDFLQHTGAELPLIGGPMYPCSNPELVAAISSTGAIGVVQPLSLTYVHRWDYREGLRYIRTLTDRPIGMNALIEGSNKRYRARMGSGSPFLSRKGSASSSPHSAIRVGWSTW
jgi:nitronate monooxygenase